VIEQYGAASVPFDGLSEQAGLPELLTYFVAADAALEQRVAKRKSDQDNGFDKPVASKSIISILHGLLVINGDEPMERYEDWSEQPVGRPLHQ
jgi:hypothetical protein